MTQENQNNNYYPTPFFFVKFVKDDEQNNFNRTWGEIENKIEILEDKIKSLKKEQDKFKKMIAWYKHYDNTNNIIRELICS